MLSPWKRIYDKPRQHFKRQIYYFIDKGPSSQSYGFSSSHVWMWELDHKESWIKKLMFLSCGVGEDSRKPLRQQGDQINHPKGNQFWIFTRRTNAEARAPIFWPRDVKNWLIWKDFDAGKDWGQEKKGTTEDEMAGWLHWLYWHAVEQPLGVGDGQGNVACCSPWDHNESDTTEGLNWNAHLRKCEEDTVWEEPVS